MTARRRSKRPGAALALAVLVFLGACNERPREVRETVYVFGTLVEFVIRGVDRDTAAAAIAAVSRDFQRMHTDWHAWKGTGELIRLNQALRDGRPFTASAEMAALVGQARDLSRRSGGRFDPAVGALVGAWGFHADELPEGPPPLDDIRAIAARAPRMDDLILDGTTVSSRNPAVQLDFGGFAKGAALDRGMARLREMGIRDAIINAGGDLDTMGRAGERPWRVGIRHPAGWGVVAAVDLEGGECLYTSGNYERYREHEGVRYAHIIDPRTGMPVQHVASASVLHTDGALADAAATALAVAGPEQWAQTAAAMGLEQVLLIDDAGTAYTTPAMAARLRFEPGQPARLVVVDPRREPPT